MTFFYQVHMLYYRPWSQGNIFIDVCHSVHRGVCIPACTWAGVCGEWGMVRVCVAKGGVVKEVWQRECGQGVYTPPPRWPLTQSVPILLEYILGCYLKSEGAHVFHPLHHVKRRSLEVQLLVLLAQRWVTVEWRNLYFRRASGCEHPSVLNLFAFYLGQTSYLE